MSMWKILFLIALSIGAIIAFPLFYRTVHEAWQPVLYPNPLTARGDLINQAGGQVANRAQGQYDSTRAKTDQDLLNSAEAAAKRMQDAADWQHKLKRQPLNELAATPDEHDKLPAAVPPRQPESPARSVPERSRRRGVIKGDLPVLNCGDVVRTKLNAVPGTIPTKLTVVNNASTVVKVWWFDENRQRHDIGAISPQYQMEFNSFAEHYLGIAILTEVYPDSGQCLGFVHPVVASSTVYVEPLNP